MSVTDEIRRLKEEKNAVILAHYYVSDEVQEIADYIGDSFYLSKVAVGLKEQTIVFCGVSFMGESAKILNPDKTVLMPDLSADCAMAHMAYAQTIQKMRDTYEDLAVVCYINSTATLKSAADVCVTSSNAINIVRKLPNQHIFFIPDGNLGAYVKEQVPEKDVILNDGYCPVHKNITLDDVNAAKSAHQGALFLVHPECIREVVAAADFVGSTADIIKFAKQSEAKEFIIGTEDGVMYELKQQNPDKKFYSVMNGQCCEDMKKVTLLKMRAVL